MLNNSLMNRKIHIPKLSLRLLLALVCLLLFAKLVEKNILFQRFDERHAARIQKTFTEKELSLLRQMDILEQCMQATDRDSSFAGFQKKYAPALNKRGLYLFIYLNDTLEYWSSKDVAAPETYSSSELNKPYVSLGNSRYASGKYASFVKEQNSYTLVGLVLIKHVHVVENKYLKTAFQKDFGLPANVKISPEQVVGETGEAEEVGEAECYPITDRYGQPMWYLIFDSTCFYQFRIYIPALLYLLVIIVFIIFLDSIFGILRTTAAKNLYLPALALILTTVRLAMQHWQMPKVFYELDIFKPVHFASTWFPSFGELYLWCIFICFFVVELYRFLKFPLFYHHRWKYYIYISLSVITMIIGFFVISALFKNLIINSSDVFESANRTLLLNQFTVLGYTVIMLFLASAFLLLDKTLLLCKQEMSFYQFLISYMIILLLVIVGWSMVGWQVCLISVIFLSVMVFTAGIYRLKKNEKFKYSHYILLVFISALFISVYINRNCYEKFENQKKTLVTNLASQHDLTAEFLFKNISERIISDTTTLVDYAYMDFLDDANENENVLNYIKAQYFYYSFWDQYKFRCWVCDNAKRLDLIAEQRRVNCLQHFKNITDNMGVQLPRSQFWYIDRHDIVSYYLGWFYVKKDGENPLQIVIDLLPSGVSDKVGYPELLLDDRLAKNNNLKGYSYAKYIQNKRITQYGDFRYNLKGDMFQFGESDYHTVYYDGKEHLVYRPDENNMIVLSSTSTKFSDQIINFSYIFIFFFVVVSLGLLIFYLPAIRRRFQWNFRNKFQYTLIVIMLVSFAVIGIYTVRYINWQYQKKNIDIVTEKMQAIHTELRNNMLIRKNMEEKEDDDRDVYAGWLSDYQRLFHTDINLFDVRGLLIATSQPDIFHKGLVGRQINPNAYIKLVFGQRTSIIEREQIGGLRYISAYETLVDNDNQVMAFLNLPYFTHQDALTEEISNTIMTLLNFYIVIILLAVIVSVMMSNQLTHPLMMLQEKFRNIKLGAKNDPIHYKRNDEVGGLVKEYNRAIEELARSANRLARSERESAWREMARQIAHEINNPLTPMKLSIQHLKRAYDNKSERFDQYMEKISCSLVEQIDTLSAIATEFSNFAKMPKAHNERIDLIEKINSVIALFAVDENKRSFHTNFHGLEKATVFADKEQMLRVFINLFKNALQAIPKNRQAEIHVDVLKFNRIIWIRIKDNGTGIPEEMQERIFRPNFTTKSSGMGLGLSIVHNLVESAGGTINFKTIKDEGTTFIISLPAAE